LQAAKAPVDGQRIDRLLRDLDSDTFAVREGAFRELEGLGAWAAPRLREALQGKPSPEFRRRAAELIRRHEEREERGPDPGLLRDLRAVEVLEGVGTAEAREVLQVLARGAPESRLTQEARASLQRLDLRTAIVP
jgi:hypothetical protein